MAIRDKQKFWLCFLGKMFLLHSVSYGCVCLLFLGLSGFSRYLVCQVLKIKFHLATSLQTYAVKPIMPAINMYLFHAIILKTRAGFYFLSRLLPPPLFPIDLCTICTLTSKVHFLHYRKYDVNQQGWKAPWQVYPNTRAVSLHFVPSHSPASKTWYLR